MAYYVSNVNVLDNHSKPIEIVMSYDDLLKLNDISPYLQSCIEKLLSHDMSTR